MISFDVKNRWSGEVRFTAEIDCDESASRAVKFGLAVRWALKNDASLSDANLRGASLSDANLRGADLSYADLSYADLRYADLSYADLRDADLRYADLRGADLSGANLSDANLRGASLSDANLRGADLRGADLSGASLSDANLRGAEGADLAIARTRILPEGDLIGWKAARHGVIVKLRIPEDARRSHAFGRKCRAEFADVLEIHGAEEAESVHQRGFMYRAGKRVTCDEWCEDYTLECAGGIHFFITRAEAEAY